MTVEEGTFRWAVFSDTHGNAGAMRHALSCGSFAAIVHLGDGIHDAADLSMETGLLLYGVSGNEDGDAEYPERLTVSMGPHSALLMHGHRMDITPYLNPEEWERRVAAMNDLLELSCAGVLLFGHTHVPFLRRTARGILCNPGSHYIGSQVPHTFAIVEWDGQDLHVRLLEQRGIAWTVVGEASLGG
ncbi:MAG: hypothetical protein E4G96_02740 [Chrysiogenales bacterium]|nr:MAG: hypothetical protein E4G96_02740 [Chrysiogenales bacterium]